MEKQKLIEAREWIRAELDRCAAFWLENGIDKENGGEEAAEAPAEA